MGWLAIGKQGDRPRLLWPDNIIQAARQCREDEIVVTVDGLGEWWIRASAPEAEAYVPEIDDARSRLWAEAKRRRDAVIEGGCLVSGVGRFDTDLVSRTNIAGAVTGAMLAQAAGETFVIDWKLADNSIVTLDGGQIMAVGMAVLSFVGQAHSRAQQIGTAVDGAADMSALDAIDISAGWPGAEEELHG